MFDITTATSIKSHGVVDCPFSESYGVVDCPFSESYGVVDCVCSATKKCWHFIMYHVVRPIEIRLRTGTWYFTGPTDCFTNVGFLEFPEKQCSSDHAVRWNTGVFYTVVCH